MRGQAHLLGLALAGALAIAAPLRADTVIVELGAGIGETEGFAGGLRWEGDSGWFGFATFENLEFHREMLACCETDHDRAKAGVGHLWDFGLALEGGWHTSTLTTKGTDNAVFDDEGWWGRASWRGTFEGGRAWWEVGAGLFSTEGAVSELGIDTGRRKGNEWFLDAEVEVPFDGRWSWTARWESGWRIFEDYRDPGGALIPDTKISLAPQRLATGLVYQVHPAVDAFALWQRVDFDGEPGIGYDHTRVDGYWIGLAVDTAGL